MSLIAGIDLNSNTVDVCLLDEDTMDARWVRYRIDDAKNLDAFDRARRLRDAMPARTAWADAGVIAIGIEKPMAFGRMGGIVPQMRVQGALLACLPADMPIYEFVPATWKKLALGNGHATKEAGAVWAAHTIHWQDARGHLPQDAIDAACIAKAAQIKHYAQTGAAAA